MNEYKLVWCVDYATATGNLIHSRLFATEGEARAYYDERKFCPYREIYQTHDIWHFLEKHGK